MGSKRVGYSHVLQEMCQLVCHIQGSTINHLGGVVRIFAVGIFFYLLRDLQHLRIAPPDD